MRDMQAVEIIDRLGLAPHPEGGWYAERWRGEATADSGRSAGTAIYYLLEKGQRSHWHKVVDATELWLWHAGSPLSLGHAPGDAGPIAHVTLGPDVLAGQQPHYLIPADHWQSAEAGDGWVLVSCVVVPGFDFSGFVLAPPGWSPGG